MLQLYINNKPAIIKSGSSFKLTRENPYFSDAGDYTLDITLPLRGCIENQAIFGSIHRKDVSLVSLINKKYTAKLVAAPITLDGSVVVTQVDQDEIKVQLVAGRSEVSIYGKDSKGQDYYINQLDLGKVYANMGDYSSLEELWNAIRLLSGDEREVRLWGTTDAQVGWDGGGGFVMFPIYAKGNESHANIYRVNCWYDYTGTNEDYAEYQLGFYCDSDGGAIIPPGTNSNVTLPDPDEDYALAAQPYIWYVVEKVLKAIGYEVDAADNILRTNWAKDVFMANPKAVLYMRNMMPEWTVTEFLKEIRKFFGVLFRVYTKDGEKHVKVTDLADSYTDTDTFVELSEVSDEWTAEVESDDDATSEDTSTSDVAYAYPDSIDWLNVPDEIFQAAKILDSFESISDDMNKVADYYDAKNYDAADAVMATLMQYIVHFSDETDYRYNRDFIVCPIYDNDGHVCQCTTREIDGGGKLIRSGDVQVRGDAIELKICPVPVDRPEVVARLFSIADGKENYYFSGKYTDVDGLAFNVYELLSSGSTVSNSMVKYSVYNQLAGEDETEDEQVLDAIEVAYNPGALQSRQFKTGNIGPWNVNIPLVYGLPWYEAEDGTYLPIPINTGLHRELCLKWSDIDGVASHALNKNSATDTRVQHVFSFTDWGDFSPEDVYLIHGKKYACTKIEITIDERGLQPMKKGYFVEIN